MPVRGFTELQRRIAAALQVDGRASWRRIAEALGEPERTVTRHGTELLSSGAVAVAGMNLSGSQMIVACESVLGAAQLVSETLARRDDVVYSYRTTGDFNVVAELGYEDNLDELLTLQLPATTGLKRLTAFPVLRYFKTIRGWRCGALTSQEIELLSAKTAAGQTGADRTEWSLPETRGVNDSLLIHALREDGRVSIETLARAVKMSESSVGRRVDWLMSSGQLSIRALVEPADVGYPVEAMLWVQVPPSSVESLGRALQQWPEVRYAAAVAGKFQMIVNITATSHAQLYGMLAHSVWAESRAHVRTDLVYAARKRGGRVLSPL